MAKRVKRKPVLDLRRDFADIYAHLTKRVQGFDPAGDDVLGDAGPVKAIAVGFECTQAGWLVVVFDTRPDAAPDGEWTSLIDGNELELPTWLEVGEADGPVSLIQLDGTETELPEDAELAEFIGETVKAVLIKARADGLFAGLLKAPGCELLIEDFDGGYGWPDYEARGQENLADPDAAPPPKPSRRTKRPS